MRFVKIRATAKQLALFDRVSRLVFGHYAWTDEMTKVGNAGSGIFVAPSLALSARHVSRSYVNLDPAIEGRLNRNTVLDPQYAVRKVYPNFSTLIHQPPTSGKLMTWGVKVDWSSHDTDITSLVAEPESESAKENAGKMDFVELQLLAPHWRAELLAYGFPKQNIEITNGDHVHDVELAVEPARVAKIIEPIHSHGFGEFPCFQLDRELPHGFSGGPVFFDGRLVGIFSGPDLVASLWPLSLHTYLDADGAEHSFAEHFESGYIRTRDWSEVRGRVRRAPCDEALKNSAVTTRCLRSHAVIMT